MSFKELDLKLSYSSEVNNSILNEFYKPILRESIKYHRAVGYFSCQSLVLSLNGIDINNSNIKIQLVVSPQLSSQDYEEIMQGYKERDEVIENKIIEIIDNEIDFVDKKQIGLVANLIANGTLDILVASPVSNDDGIYHEKYGIFYDQYENKIAFVGSLNETYSALVRNYESFDVYVSWNERDNLRIIQKESEFQKLISNTNERLSVIKFPEAAKEKLLKFCDIDIYCKENRKVSIPQFIDKNIFKVRPYQEDAITKWIENDYIGLFTMATGTGKTHTALCASVRLVENKNISNLLTIVVCPYKHLIDQWEEDAILYGYEIIKASSDFKWEIQLKNKMRNLKSKIINNLMVIVSNDTFSGEKFQKIIRKNTDEVLLIIDEAHNFGTTKKMSVLDDFFIHRIALSATPKRHFDESGTSKLVEYFGGEIFKFDLEAAINEGFLTRYYYYPVVINLTDDEFQKYIEISKALIPYLSDIEKNKDNEFVKMKLIERSRIITLAKNKEHLLKSMLKEYTNSHNNIVYCGAGTNDLFESELRQIDNISNILGNELGMECHQFTYNESYSTRKELINRFQNQDLQALIAIKCLDEGVNIPSIERAFILSSSTNPKEYIQRRGRVLRKYKNKKYAYIYDFVTLPRDIQTVNSIPQEAVSIEKSIIRRELRRLIEFSRLSENSMESWILITEIADAYKIDIKGEFLNGEE